MSNSAELITVGPKNAGKDIPFTAKRFADVVQNILIAGGIVSFETKDELFDKKPLIENKSQPWGPDTHQMVKITIEVCEYKETEHG